MSFIPVFLVAISIRITHHKKIHLLRYLNFKQKKTVLIISTVFHNREDRIRTCDPLVPNQVLYQAELLPVAKTRPRGVEPLTFWSVVKHSIQLSYGRILRNAEDRNRTGTVITHRRILSPVRLPVPPPRRNELAKRKTGFEPATPTLARWCSTTELFPQNGAG